MLWTIALVLLVLWLLVVALVVIIFQFLSGRRAALERRTETVEGRPRPFSLPGRRPDDRSSCG